MKVCLIVIDGWGFSKETEGNAVHNAKTPVMDNLQELEERCMTLDAHGTAVGLPEGLMGNSEVGHLNIGAGRIVDQDIVRINKDVDEKKISSNDKFLKCTNEVKSGNGRLHFIGLVSDGGIHSHISHLLGMLESAKKAGVPKTFIHFFSDGRDTHPTCATDFIQQLLDKIGELKYGKLATVMGRYYAMDRDKNYDRTKIAYEAMVQGKGDKSSQDDIVATIKSKYENENETDEDLKPIIVNEDGLIKDGDTLVFINFRADRIRQISEAFGIEQHFETDKVPENLNIYTMTQYKKEFPFEILYPPNIMDNVLSEWLSKKDIPQFHCAETEKYAHVTFFFNGGREEAFEKEDRQMVPSPKVATYDLKPEMSVIEVAEEVANAIMTKKYGFVMCNFAPPDMVGHTGKYKPAIKAVEATDRAIGIVAEACQTNDYILVVTADHGNAEVMIDEDGGPHKKHTTNRVPFIISYPPSIKKTARCDLYINTTRVNVALCDVAPTILDLMGLQTPPEMTGKSLI